MYPTRRDFLQTSLRTSTLIALAPTVPAFLAQTARAAKPARDQRVLVVVELAGGNDGINTVVPFKDDGYAKHRQVLRLSKDQLIKVNAEVGLHPALGDAGKLLESGRLAIVQGVGYPNPNRSHFESMAIWHSARLRPEERDGLGWIGQALDSSPHRAGVPAALFAGAGDLPPALRSRRAVTSALSRPEDFILAPTAKPARVAASPETKDDLAAFLQRNAVDAYTIADRMAEVARGKDNPKVRYPATELAGRLRLLARLIKLDIGTRVFYTSQAGYDTHAAQLATHSSLLDEWAGALKAFLDDLHEARVAERVIVLSFSEFGRTVSENGSAGTDHGTSGPVFLAGPCVKAGLVGEMPSLTDLDPVHRDLRVAIDFRGVYATVLEDWLGLAPKEALGGNFKRLPLFRT